MMMMIDFYGHFYGNEAKSKIKHPSDMPTLRFELR